MLSRCVSHYLPAFNTAVVQASVIVRGAYRVPTTNGDYEKQLMYSISEMKDLKMFRSLIMKVDHHLKNYHFPNSVRKHVMTRSVLPSIKTKAYIYGVKARLDDQHLQQVCDNRIDPMNRYNEDFTSL
ncbi:hypothetical protein WA588_003042, partial [Blastocystis sp. NMH]